MHTTANSLLKDTFWGLQSAFSAAEAGFQDSFAEGELLLLVSNVLLKLGISVNVKGYAYLREAILCKVASPEAEIPITTVLYPAIAVKFQTSASRVERAIRHAIQAAWSRADQSKRDNDLFFLFINYEKKPSNSQFIAMIAECILLLNNRRLPQGRASVRPE